MKLQLLSIILVVQAIYVHSQCQDETYCLTLPKDTIIAYCSSFLKAACKESCGLCAAESLKRKFTVALDKDGNGQVSLEEGQNLLKALKIDSNDALLTEIKELIFDSKASLTDLFEKFDVDKNNALSVDEFFFGLVNFLETIGINVVPEMKNQIRADLDVIKQADTTPVSIPNLVSLIEFITKQTGSYPHGLITLIRLQNLTSDEFEFERIMSANEAKELTINGKFYIRDVLEYLDMDDNNYVDHKEITNTALSLLRRSNTLISEKANQSIAKFFDILDKQLINVLNKYGYSDLAQLDGLVIPELGNTKYVDSRINIKKNMQNPVEFTSAVVKKYIKSATNAEPIRKLSYDSVVEAILLNFDKNNDYKLDLTEFGEFTVNSLKSVEAGLSDFVQVLKLMTLSDTNADSKIDLNELLEILRPIKYEVF